MVPAQFFRIAKAKLNERAENWKFMDLLNAVRCTLFANANRNEGVQAFKTDDFRVFPDKKRDTPEEIMATMDRLAKRQEG